MASEKKPEMPPKLHSSKNKKKKGKGDKGDENDQKSPFQRPGMLIYWAVLIVLGGYWIFYLSGDGAFGDRQKIEYSTFRAELEQNNIRKVLVKGPEIRGQLERQIIHNTASGDTVTVKQFYTYIPSFGDDALMSKLEENRVVVDTQPPSDGSWWTTLIWFIPMLLMLFIFLRFYRGMKGGGGGAGGQGFFNIGKSQAKLYDQTKEKTSFDDVAGVDGAKTELREVIAFLTKPDKFKAIGAKIPKGVLLVGPPGTGKTMLARAVAGEAGVPFFTITGSDFMEMFVGVGAKRVRDMFEKAKEKSPCIIFIDELDSIGRRRGAGLGGGHDEREQTLNQLLSEMDGFEPHENVIVMAATNRPDILDKALLRPGRFDRQITVDNPHVESREKILEIHAKNKKLDESVSLEEIAKSTPGFSGADLENLLNEAALHAARQDRNTIEKKDVEEARDKIMMGLEREGMQLDDDTRKMIAYHEAGHALIAAALPNSDPIHKVTIVPRGKAMGVTMQLPSKEQYIVRKEYMVDRLSVLMGGRAAENIIFSTATSGAENDLKQATKIARKMVLDWGMSDEFENMAYGEESEQVFLGKDLSSSKKYSEETGASIDKSIKKILDQANKTARDILTKYSDQLDKIAELLLEHEEIEGKQVDELLSAEE